MANQTGTTTAAVNVRTGPGTQHARITALLPKTPLEVLGEQGDWLQIKTGSLEGFVHRKFVLLASQGVNEGFLRSQIDPPSPPPPDTTTTAPPRTTATPSPGALAADIPLTPPDDQKLPVNPKAPLLERLCATTWNKFGGLLTALSQELNVDPAVAVAVLAVESGGRGFGPDGRMLIRFENQVFFDRWGKFHPDQYHQHFQFNPDKRWTNHKWRPTPDGPWLPTDKDDFHGDQSREWAVFGFARTLDDTAAKSSISMGGPQIMGFNHASLGFESVQQMFDAFAANERNQIIGFFDFVQGPGMTSRRVLALQDKDFETFASMYNGPGQAAKYGGLIRTVFDTFHTLKPA
jgi:hypothetical protein